MIKHMQSRTISRAWKKLKAEADREGGKRTVEGSEALWAEVQAAKAQVRQLAHRGLLMLLVRPGMGPKSGVRLSMRFMFNAWHAQRPV